MRRIAQNEGLEPLEPGAAHGTRVHYRNLARYTRVFVAGTVVGNEAGLEACVPRAQVRLARGSDAIGNTTSDAYGDFRFDALAPSSGHYRVEVTAEGYQGRTLDFELADSHWLGEIRLDLQESGK